MNFYKIIILIIYLIVILSQHVIHEYSHVLVAKINGVGITKIQWFTYSRYLLGTRVFYENEPNFDEKNIEKKWGWISISGFVSTTIIGYLFTLIRILYLEHISNWLTLIVCLFSIVFLTFDSLYFVLGSIFDFGDIIGFRKVFRIKKLPSMVFSFLVLIFNIFLIRLVWYSS